LGQSAVRQRTRPDAFAYYEMDRAIDRVFCAMNLLVQGDTVKAMAQLKEAMQWRHFRTVCRRPRRLGHLMGGAGLFVMGSLGTGVIAGRCLYGGYQSLRKRRRKGIP
jgi:hypothetical protein